MIKLLKILKESTQEYKLYCDLDGVLVNFDKGFKDLTGYYSEDFEKKFGREHFWDKITAKGAKFWAELEWMPEGKQLWSHIKKYNPTLLSAPSREESSRIGKKEWIARELPNTPTILVPAYEKQNYASPNSILIDDSEKNIEQWKNAGGIAILHKNNQDTFQQLKQLGL